MKKSKRLEILMYDESGLFYSETLTGEPLQRLRAAADARFHGSIEQCLNWLLETHLPPAPAEVNQ